MGGRRRRQERFELDGGMTFWGVLVGLAAGALYALLNAPRSGAATRHQITSAVNETSETIRERIDAVVPSTDPITESIAEGKAAARRRRAEMGLPELD